MEATLLEGYKFLLQYWGCGLDTRRFKAYMSLRTVLRGGCLEAWLLNG